MHNKGETRIKENKICFCPIERAILKLTYFENELNELEQELKETNVKYSFIDLIKTALTKVQNARFEFEQFEQISNKKTINNLEFEKFDLKVFRQSKSINQTEFSKILGISRSTIVKIEGGEIKLSLKIYNKILSKWKN